MTTPLPSQTPNLRPVWPTAKQAFVTLGGGLLLAASTCGGALANFNINHDSTAFNVFMVLFLLSLPVVAAGVLLVIVRLVQLAGRRRGARSAHPAASIAGAVDAAGAAPGTTSPLADTSHPPATDPLADAGDAWPAVVRATLAGIASVGAFVAMTLLDPNPIALLFLAIGLAAAAGSLVYFVIAGVRLLARR